MFGKLLLVAVSGAIAIITAITVTAWRPRDGSLSLETNAPYFGEIDQAAFRATQRTDGSAVGSITYTPVIPTFTPISSTVQNQESSAPQSSAENPNEVAGTPAVSSPQEPPAPTAVFTPSPFSSGHIFYTSSASNAKYYYCDTDNSWKNLSPLTLRIFNSEQELLASYNRVLHTVCSSPEPTPLPSATSVPSSSSPSPTPAQTPETSAAPTQTPASSPETTPTAAPTPTTAIPTSTPSATPSPDYTVTLVSLTSPIKRGSTAKLEIETAPEAQCSLKVTLPSGSISGAKDILTGQPLGTFKAADSSGYVTWQWQIGGSTTASPPDASIDINCSSNGESYSKILQMTITK